MPLPFNNQKGKPMGKPQGGKANVATAAPPQAPAQQQDQQALQPAYDQGQYWQTADPNYGWYGWTEPYYDQNWDYGPSSWNESSYGYATSSTEAPKKKKKKKKEQNPFALAATAGYYSGPIHSAF